MAFSSEVGTGSQSNLVYADCVDLSAVENASKREAKRMIRATRVLGQHRWSEPAADTVVLDFDDRHRRRMAMTGTRGFGFLRDLGNAAALPGGAAACVRAGRRMGG